MVVRQTENLKEAVQLRHGPPDLRISSSRERSLRRGGTSKILDENIKDLTRFAPESNEMLLFTKDAMLALDEVDAVYADFTKCSNLILPLCGMFPDTPGIWTGTVSERLAVVLSVLEGRISHLETEVSCLEDDVTNLEDEVIRLKRERDLLL